VSEMSNYGVIMAGIYSYFLTKKVVGAAFSSIIEE
jgi:hypothetical protein